MILKLKKKNFTAIKILFCLGDVDINHVLVSIKIYFGEKTINTLLVTYMMIIKLNHYIKCFQKWAYM